MLIHSYLEIISTILELELLVSADFCMRFISKHTTKVSYTYLCHTGDDKKKVVPILSVEIGNIAFILGSAAEYYLRIQVIDPV